MVKNNKEMIKDNMINYCKRFENLAHSQFEWHGLPDNYVDWFEHQLIYNGVVLKNSLEPLFNKK